MRFWKKKYKVKKEKIDRGYKPSVASLNPWSKVFFIFALSGLVWGSVELLGLTEYDYITSGATSTTSSSTSTSSESGEVEDEFVVIQVSEEQLLEQINTIAYQDAIWPGYKGDKLDGDAVSKHFHENLAKIIIANAKGYEIFNEYVIHFYYAVRKDGGIQYYAIVKGGKTSKNLPTHLVKVAQQTLNIGIPGIIPAKNANGDPITVVHQLVIRFKPQY